MVDNDITEVEGVNLVIKAREAAPRHPDYRRLPFKIGDKVMVLTLRNGVEEFVPAEIDDILLGYSPQTLVPELIITVQYEDKSLGVRKVGNWETDIKTIS